MPATRDRSIASLTGLILAPVGLLAGIAIFGLVQSRHAITEDARAEAERWASPKQAELALATLVAEARARPAVVLFRDIPDVGETDSPDAARLTEATARKDLPALRALLDSPATTAAGLPIRVLAAWRVLDLTGETADAERLATLAIHEAPSAISAPIVEALTARFPETADWISEWQLSEERRAILTTHPIATGLFTTANGPALITDGKVLTPREIRTSLATLHENLTLPEWMDLDYLAAGTSVIAPIEEPFVKAGSKLTLVVGIADEEALYSRYWRIVWWVAALILCSLLTAVAGIWLVQRTVSRERRLNQLKSHFVASVSHELRTPVASMRLMADALDEGKVTGAKAKEFHRLISQEGARLSALIENVLEFARIEEGRKDYVFAETDLPAMVTDTIRLMEPVAQEREVRITAQIDSADGSPSLDSAAIQQALVNLLDNAIKFSPVGGEVRVTLTSTSDAWSLSVADQGPGIAVDDRARVFERFTRLGNELRRETRGAGIGLSIVRHTVDAHRGTVSIEDGEDGGTVFVIRGANGAKVRDAAAEHSSGTEVELEAKSATP